MTVLSVTPRASLYPRGLRMRFLTTFGMTEKRNDKKEGSGMTRRGMGNHEANRGSGGREDAGMAAERVG
jgi:hypothetical protein